MVVLGPRPMTPEDFNTLRKIMETAYVLAEYFQNRLYTGLRTRLTSVVYLKYKYVVVIIFDYAELGACVGDCCLKRKTNYFILTTTFNKTVA